MSSKYDKVEQLYRQLVPRLSRPEYWDKMLRPIAPFWKLANFTEGMLLTEQLPNATAVASFEQWKKMGRYVKFREKSVMVFASEFDTSAKYLFDISQTYGNAITPKWEMNARLADGIIAKSEEYFGVNVTNLHHLITKSLDNKLISDYNYICKSIPAVSTDSRVRQLIYDSAKVICMTRCGISPAEIQADFSNIGLLKKEISRIEIGNAGFELAKQVLREIDKAVRSEINERNHDESNVRGRDLRDTLRGEERDLLSEGRQLRQEGHEHTRPESPRSDGGAGQNSASVHKHERTVPHDMGGDSPESGAQPQRNPGGAETENAVQPEHRNEGAAADGDIHSGAGLGMGYDQELRELADSGSSVEEHDSGTEHDNPFDDDGSLTETAEYDNEVDFSDGGSTSFLSGDQYSLFDTAPPAAEASKDQNNTALTELLMTGTGFEDGKWRVYTYYNSEHPSTEEFANFLKKEYGIGGSSSVSDTFKFSWYDAKGIKITMNSGEDVLFRWNVAAKTAAGLLDSGEYFSQKDNDNHIRNCVCHARESIQYENPYSTQTGICTFMTKVALDGRILDPEAEDYEGSKINQCVKRILEIDRENPKTAQVVFCDTNTPKYDGKFTVYEDIKQKLIESGQYKPEEIAFVHDAKNDKQRIETFEKVNEAKIRLIIGSTGKLGTGVNIQRSLIAMHHLDAPYRPSDIEQRNGRGIRQGNNNPEVNVIYYATKGTFDTYRWQLLEKKQETASKVLSGKPVSRSCKDIDEVALTFSEMKAATTDNPLVAEKLTVDNEVARLSLLETEYLSHHRQLAHDIQEVYPKNIQSFTRQRENTIIDIQTLNSNPYIDECFRIEFDGRMITEKEKAAAEFESKARAYMIGEAFRGGEPVFFAKYHGFEIGLRRSDQYSCSILVKGANLYKSDYNNSGTGAITRIDNMLERLAKQPEEFSAAIEKAEKQLANARSLYDRPFEYAAELKELIEKQAYLNAQLEFGSDSNDDQIVDDNDDDEGESEEMEM